MSGIWQDLGLQTPRSGITVEECVLEDGTVAYVECRWSAGSPVQVRLDECWISDCAASVRPGGVGLCDYHLEQGREGELGEEIEVEERAAA